jgi:uncharacterized protein Smg (DUF494 family)
VTAAVCVGGREMVTPSVCVGLDDTLCSLDVDSVTLRGDTVALRDKSELCEYDAESESIDVKDRDADSVTTFVVLGGFETDMLYDSLTLLEIVASLEHDFVVPRESVAVLETLRLKVWERENDTLNSSVCEPVMLTSSVPVTECDAVSFNVRLMLVDAVAAFVSVVVTFGCVSVGLHESVKDVPLGDAVRLRDALEVDECVEVIGMVSIERLCEREPRLTLLPSVSDAEGEATREREADR